MRRAVIDPDLLEHIYDVVLDRSSWDAVLGRLRTEYSADAGVLIAYARGPRADTCLCLSGHDESAWRSYAAHFAAVDPYAARMGSKGFPAGRVCFGDDVVPAKTLLASEYYHDWLRPNGIRYTAGAHVQSQAGMSVMLGLPRSEAAGPYSAEEIQRLQAYFNHIRRALEIQSEMGARVSAPDLDRLAVRYGFTPAEIRLLELLAETGSLKKSAQRLARSYYTLRAQLRALFQKTGTHSQVQLVRLIHQQHDGSQ